MKVTHTLAGQAADGLVKAGATATDLQHIATADAAEEVLRAVRYLMQGRQDMIAQALVERILEPAGHEISDSHEIWLSLGEYIRSLDAHEQQNLYRHAMNDIWDPSETMKARITQMYDDLPDSQAT